MDAALTPVPQRQPDRLGPLVIGRDLSPAEASRLCDDGLLVRCVGDVVVEPAALETARHRAACVVGLLRHEGVDPEAWVVGHEAACWVHSGWPAVSRRTALETVVVLGPRGRS